MKFNIALETSIGVEDKTHLIIDLSNRLSNYFSVKDYGKDVIEIIIRIISVAPEFEWFSTIKKPKYKFYRKHTRDSVEIIEDRLFSFGVKVDYEKLKNQSDEQNEQMLALEILESLSNFDSLPKKVKGFDKERFRKDMKDFLKESALLAD